MKPFDTDIHICSCPNQHLLFVGDICELCMGMVSENIPTFHHKYLLPAGDGMATSKLSRRTLKSGEIRVRISAIKFRMAVSDPFDELYFEELETYYEDIEYSA
jgi:hypothetical protein